MTSHNRHTLNTSDSLMTSQLYHIVTSNTTRDMGSIANVSNKTSDRGKSLYQIPHPYTCTLCSIKTFVSIIYYIFAKL